MHRAFQMARSAKKNKNAGILTARPRTREVRVSSPTVPGAQETVQKHVSTIEHMRKRRQLDDGQYHAAERLWRAHEATYGSLGGSMDFDRARGPGGESIRMPYVIQAAEDLAFAKRSLYALDHRVIVLIACEGHSIDEATAIIRGSGASRAHKEEIGRAFRQGLRELAQHWFGARRAQREETRMWRDPDARPVEATAGVISAGKTVHATGRRIFRNR